MSVIGRLDKQVEEIIINPVGRRRRAPDEADAPDDAPLTPPAPRDEPTTAPANPPAPSSDGRRDDGELPVWLL